MVITSSWPFVLQKSYVPAVRVQCDDFLNQERGTTKIVRGDGAEVICRELDISVVLQRNAWQEAELSTIFSKCAVSSKYRSSKFGHSFIYYPIKFICPEAEETAYIYSEWEILPSLRLREAIFKEDKALHRGILRRMCNMSGSRCFELHLVTPAPV